MTQLRKIVGLWVVPALVAGVVLYALLWGRGAPTAQGSASEAGPPRLVANGPYVRELVMSWSQGGVDVTLRAARLCFVKSTLMGMDNALMKKMRLDDVVVAVRRGDDELLRMTKARIEGAPSGRRFVLESPTVLFPKGARKPDKAVIHKQRRQIVFWYGKESRTLDFSGANAGKKNGW